MSFIQLQIHTAYSLLRSTVKIESLVEKAKTASLSALAITDINVMHGVIPFYKECKKHGIKPIIGLTADILHGEESYPLVLYARNYKGYVNLLKISSAIKTKSPQGLPEKWLKGYADGLLALTPGRDGAIEQALLQEKTDQALQFLHLFQSIFGEKYFYLALQRVKADQETLLNNRLRDFANHHKLQLVATNPVYYLDQNDALAQEALMAIEDGVKLSDESRRRLPSRNFYLKSAQEMFELFEDIPEALENAMNIGSLCNVEIPLNRTLLPKYPVPEKKNAHEYLKEICQKGFQERYKNPPSHYLERLNYELHVIGRMNFSDYFLIVWDFMRYARSKKILTGPGRGSAAGSMVAYVLYITDVDPMKHNLLFERFLNPERISMPDIDIDFPDERRDEVISYVASKYGELHVAQILTFGTFAAKAAIRDCGRVFGLNTKELDTLSKMVPSRLGITIEQALKESKPLRDFYEENECNQRLIQTALKLEGLPRHTSTHAAGVVISDLPLTEVIAIQEGHGGIHLTQFSMDILEEIGLLKMDFLGLRNLTLIDHILTSIHKTTGKKIDIQSIPLNDQATFKLLSRGETTGIFQFESEGMRKVLMQLRPERFEDLVAVNALYRPGPMENIPSFIKRRHGLEKVTYPHPDLKDILESTYGVIVYQEQIMKIASKFAGFSLGEADLLRRAVSKKKRDVLNEQRQHFVMGAIKQGYKEETANEIYDLIVRFADYGFNLSHAVAYSFIAYQLAYLKARFPLQFMASLMTSVIGNEEKISQYVRELKGMGIELLPPSINESAFSFKTENGKIRYSLAAIKGIGGNALREIFQARRQKPFEDLFDFCMRVSSRAINRKVMESLIHSGAFDEFGQDRASLLATLDVAIDHAELVKLDDGQGDLFADSEFTLKPKYVKVEPIDIENKLLFEKAALGFYLSSHPVEPFQDLFTYFGGKPLNEMEKMQDTKALVGVYISEVKTIRTKKGEVMAFLTISDDSGEMEAVIFPNVYKKDPPLYKKGNIVMLQGNMESRNGHKQFIVQQAYSLETLKKWSEEVKAKLFIRIERKLHSKILISKLKNILNQYPGKTSVHLFYEQENRYVRLPVWDWVNPTEHLLERLKSLVGEKNVVLRSQ